MSSEPSVPAPEESDAGAPDVAMMEGGAMGGGGGMFDVGATVVLFNGSLCYEAEILQVRACGRGAAVSAAAARRALRPPRPCR